MKSKTIVTSALPYVNNVPHLGTMVCIISADVYTRFLRLVGHPVISVVGTDEHGTTTEVKAIEDGVTPREVCDKYFAIQKDVYEWFNCDYDCVGRSSSKENIELTHEIFNDLHQNGYIIEDEMEMAYCEHDKRFLADRFVEGTCPHCAYEEARGDQCENCGKLLDAHELKAPHCKICKHTPIFKTTKHLFMDLPKIEPDLRKWMEHVRGKWSANAVSVTQSWLKEGLKPRCISRDLKWGIKVPLEGFEDKVFYSWFDAPIGYIGITKESIKHWDQWWQDDENTRLVQFMGKDNIPFHTILFPGFLLGTKKPWTLMDEISVNEYMNWEGGQFSKSRNIGLFGDQAKDTGIPADVWRYYIMINRPERSDTDFGWDDLAAKLNNEIVGNFANLVNRTLTFINRNYDGIIPQIMLNDADKHFLKALQETEDKIKHLMSEIQLKDALKEIMHLSKLANHYFQENEPWKVIKEDPARAGSVLGVLANVVKDLSILLWPYMPKTCEKIRHQLNLAGVKPSWDNLSLQALGHGNEINQPEILFEKLAPERVEELRKNFGGKREFALQLKIGKVVEVQEHPNADKLYVLQVDVKEDKPRQICAGLKPFVPKEELLGAKLVIVCNLKPAELRGRLSEGMLLAAEKKKDVTPLTSEADTGTEITIDGFTNNHDEITYDQFSKVKLNVRHKQIFYKDRVLTAGDDPVTVDMPDGSKVK